MNYNAYPYGRWLKWGIIGLIAVILLISSVSTYNGLVGADQKVQSQWAQVENKMERKADVLGNLVKVVEKYTTHEEEVMNTIAQARSTLMNGTADINSKLKANEEINTALKSMLVIVENYPDLKSSEQYTLLMDEVAGSENRVSTERGRFIEYVNEYNNKIKMFPGNVFARLMGFSPKEYYHASDEAKDFEIDFSK